MLEKLAKIIKLEDRELVAMGELPDGRFRVKVDSKFNEVEFTADCRQTMKILEDRFEVDFELFNIDSVLIKNKTRELF